MTELAQGLEYTKTIQTGQAQIQYQCIKILFLQQCQCTIAVVGGIHSKAFQFQIGIKIFGNGRIVFNNQDTHDSLFHRVGTVLVQLTALGDDQGRRRSTGTQPLICNHCARAKTGQIRK